MRYNMKNLIPKILAAILILTLAAPAYAVGSSSRKEEVVYGLLSQDGSVKDIYIVNIFKKGMITDYGDYSSVDNTTNSEKLTFKDDLITINNSAERFYYQGSLKSKELPWIFDIKYELGGNVILPSELAGKSGQLVISIATVENKAVNPTFFENYMLQMSITLDTEKCSDINSPGATFANAGKNKVISHMVMPGQTADISISATVKDFTMGGIEITGLPMSISIDGLNTSSLTDDMSELSDAIFKLNEGTEKLSEGVDEMHIGAKKLSDGSSSFDYGLSQLSGNSKGLVNASALIKSALGDAASALKGDDVKDFDFGALASLPAGLRQLASGLNEISTGMNALKQGYASAYDALHSSISDIPNTDIDPSPLYAAVYGNKDLTDTLDVLMQYYAEAKTVKATYASVKDAFASVEGSLKSMEGSVTKISDTLSGIADKIEKSLSGSDFAEQLEQLKDGLSEISKNYTQFHLGLVNYTNGVKGLAAEYGKVHEGIESLVSGIGETKTGVNDLNNGVGKFSDAMDKLPELIEEKTDELLDQYDKSDFIPVSFASYKNSNVASVQFVIKTDSVELPETLKPVQEAPMRLTFFQKLLKLFGLYK